MPWHIESLQSYRMGTGTSHILQLREATLREGSNLPKLSKGQGQRMSPGCSDP